MAVAGIESHQRLIARQISGYRTRVTHLAGDVDVRVEFLNGIQAGSSKDFKTSDLTIGKTAESDVILLDDSIDDRVATLTFNRTVFGVYATIQSYTDGLTVHSRKFRKDEILTEEQLPVEIEVGKHRLRVLRASDSAVGLSEYVRSARSFTGWNGLATVAGACLALFVILYLGFTAPFSSRAVEIQFNDTAPAQQTSDVAEREWLDELTGKLREYGVDQWLDVRLDGKDMLLVSGSIPVSEVPKLRDVQQWMDRQPYAPITVWNVNQARGLSQLPPIKMVRLSEPKAVFFTNGEAVFYGTEYVDGWVLTDVSRSALRFERGAEASVINIRGEGS